MREKAINLIVFVLWQILAKILGMTFSFVEVSSLNKKLSKMREFYRNEV